MKFRIVGQFSELAEISQRLDNVEDGMVEVSKAMAHEVMDSLIPGQFEKQSAPDGSKWKEIQRKGEILRDTGALLTGWGRRRAETTITGKGFIVINPVPYAPFHQFGTVRMTARKMVPESGDLPQHWEESLRDTAEEAMQLILGVK